MPVSLGFPRTGQGGGSEVLARTRRDRLRLRMAASREPLYFWWACRQIAGGPHRGLVYTQDQCVLEAQEHAGHEYAQVLGVLFGASPSPAASGCI